MAYYINSGVISTGISLSRNSMYISSGGVANSTTVNSSGYMRISSGGVANSTTVNSRGSMYIASGGTATDIVWTPCVGYVHAADGAYVTYASTYSGVYFGSNNQLLSHTDSMTGNVYGSMYVMSGGVANSTTLHDWGSMYIASGGVANSTTVNRYGDMSISSGGVANSTTVNSSGCMYISSGGVANSTTVNSGGSMYISSGGTATDIVWTPCVGYVSAADGAYVTYASTYLGVYFGSNDQLLSHTNSMTGKVVSGYFASMYVMSGGVANSTILSGGTAYYDSAAMLISSGGVANSTTVNSRGCMYISSGGVANSTTVNSGGSMRISSGGVANSTILSGSTGYYDSAEMVISSGGVANSTTVNSGGYMYIKSGGVANSTTVNSCGRMWISSGGVADEIAVYSGGSLYVASDAYATVEFNPWGGEVTEEEGANVTYLEAVGVYHGAANTGLINKFTSSAEMIVETGLSAVTFNGGTVDNMIVSAGGAINVSGGNISSLALQKDGILCGFSFDEDRIISNIVNGSGELQKNVTLQYSHIFVNDGGVLNNVSGCSYGWLNVLTGGSVFNAALQVDSYLIIDGGKASQIVNTDGYVAVDSNGSIDSVTINSAGILSVANGTATSVTVNSSGAVHLDAGAIVRNVTVNSSGRVWVSQGGILSDVIVKSNAIVYVSSNGVVKDAILNKGGSMYVSSGGTATVFISDIWNAGTVTAEIGASVSSSLAALVFYGNAYDGTLQKNDTFTALNVTKGNSAVVFSGGYTSLTTVSSGGLMLISNGGLTKSAIVESDGVMCVLSGGSSVLTVLNRGGSMTLSSGSIASDTVIYTLASLTLSSGSIHRGALQINNGGFVNAQFGTQINFDICNRSTQNAYLINDISRIGGFPEFSISVKLDQTSGVYKLAQGAGNFHERISIGNAVGSYGTITVNGEVLTVGNTKYCLFEENGNLFLSVEGKTIVSGNKNSVSWSDLAVQSYSLEYSNDNFVNVLKIQTKHNTVSTYGMSAGTYQWRVDAHNDTGLLVGDNIISDNNSETPQKLTAIYDGNTDVFFANANGVWETGYAAQHQGSGSWQGTKEQIILDGKNKIADVFTGSTDANVLVLTDSTNGDALFIDDIYTALGEQVRLTQIDEIRAGAGNDIVDMTSQQFAYIGNGVKIYGGVGDDVIWANSGDNTLFGDAGDDRLVGANGDDIIIGGTGNDSMQGGGGNDTFCFGRNFGNDTVEQLSGGSVTLYFETGSEANWNQDTLTYTDGTNSVTISGVTDVELVFGKPAPVAGAFLDASSEKIFEDKNKTLIA